MIEFAGLQLFKKKESCDDSKPSDHEPLVPIFVAVLPFPHSYFLIFLVSPSNSPQFQQSSRLSRSSGRAVGAISGYFSPEL